MYLFKISKTFCMIHYKRSDFIRNVLWKIVNISKFFVGDVSVWGKFLTIIQGLFIWIKGWNEQGVVTMIWHSCSYIIIKLKLHFFSQPDSLNPPKTGSWKILDSIFYVTTSLCSGKYPTFIFGLFMVAGRDL